MDHQVEPMHDLNQQPHHLRTPGRGKGGFSKKKLLIIGAVVAAVIALAAAAFLLLKKDTKTDSAAQNQTAQQQQERIEEDEPAMNPTEAAQPQTYKSETLNIELMHRKDWTLKEDAAKKLITLTSPKFTFQTANGSKKDMFTLMIGFGVSKDGQKHIDSTKAVRDSLLVGYDAPTEAQRHYTNISYAGVDENLFDFFIVTGSDALKPADPLAGIVAINSSEFLIAGGFGADPQNTLAFTPIPAAELEQYTAYEQAVAIVKSLKVY